MMRVLTADRVNEIFRDCLFNDDEIVDGRPPEGAVIVEGIMVKVGLNPTRLEGHKDEIIAMLHELPNEFLSTDQGGGGGWSFLNACMTKDGVQWTGMHQTQDELIQLGIGVDAASYLMERDMWSSFPGGVPYFSVNL